MKHLPAKYSYIQQGVDMAMGCKFGYYVQPASKSSYGEVEIFSVYSFYYIQYYVQYLHTFTPNIITRLHHIFNITNKHVYHKL